jgi:hypothetical protein
MLMTIQVSGYRGALKTALEDLKKAQAVKVRT